MVSPHQKAQRRREHETKEERRQLERLVDNVSRMVELIMWTALFIAMLTAGMFIRLIFIGGPW